MRAVQLRRRRAGDDDRARPGHSGHVLLVRVRGQADRQRDRRRHRRGRDALRRSTRRPRRTSFDDLPPGMCPYLAPSSWVVTEGVHTLYAGSIDKAGNQETPTRARDVQDRQDPADLAGRTRLPQFQPNPGAFTVSWSGTDNLSGIKDFDVRYRTAPAGGSFGPLHAMVHRHHADQRALHANTRGARPASRCAHVTGPAGSSRPTAPRCARPPRTTTRSLTRTGTWSTVSGSGYFGPGVSRSTTYNNKLTLTGLRGQRHRRARHQAARRRHDRAALERLDQATTSLSAASVQKKQLLTFTLAERPDRHARHRPDRLRHRRDRRRRRLQGELTDHTAGRSSMRTGSP